MKEVTTKEFEKIVEYAVSQNLSLYAEGKSGIGKSTIVKNVAIKHNKEVVDLRSSTIDIGDLVMRLPNADKTAMIELTNSSLVKNKGYVLFLDEFRHADPSIRKMFYQIIYDKKIGDYKLPEGTCIIAVSNPSEEVDTENIEAPLYDRFDIKVKVAFSFDDWKAWAFNNGVASETITFLQNFKNFLHCNYEGVPVTPRTWERISKHEKYEEYMLPDDVYVPYAAFKKKIEVFKDIDKYLNGEKEVKEGLDYQYAFASAVLAKIGTKPDDPYIKTWFTNRKVKNVTDEVITFMNFAVIQTHRARSKLTDAQYLVKIPTELKSAIVAQYKDLGYLFDNKV